MRTSFIAFILVSIFSLSFVQSSNSLPSIKLQNLKGELVDVSKYAQNNKLTVISFWATWCSPCKKELNNIAELYDDWKKDYGVEVVAISIDDSRQSAKVKSYVNSVKWPYDILLDMNEDMKRALNFQTVPFTILIDKKGKIVYRHNSYVDGDEYVLEDELKKHSK